MGGFCLFGSVAVFAAVLVASSASAQSPLRSQAQPNILFVLMDNLGYGELGVYGGGVLRGAPTPP
jgi:hypothetical protein